MKTKDGIKEIVKSSVALATGVTVGLGYFRAVPKSTPMPIKVACGIGVVGIALTIATDVKGILDNAI